MADYARRRRVTSDTLKATDDSVLNVEKQRFVSNRAVAGLRLQSANHAMARATIESGFARSPGHRKHGTGVSCAAQFA